MHTCVLMYVHIYMCVCVFTTILWPFYIQTLLGVVIRIKTAKKKRKTKAPPKKVGKKRKEKHGYWMWFVRFMSWESHGKRGLESKRARSCVTLAMIRQAFLGKKVLKAVEKGEKRVEFYKKRNKRKWCGRKKEKVEHTKDMHREKQWKETGKSRK